MIALTQWPECKTVQTVFNLLGKQHPGPKEFAELAAEKKGKAGSSLRGCRIRQGFCRICTTSMRSLRIIGSFCDRNWLVYGLQESGEVAAHSKERMTAGCTMGQLAIRWLLTLAGGFERAAEYHE